MKEFFSIFKNSLTRKCMALLMSLLVVGAASAQTRVTGTVTDESGHPLMGVTVIVVGTNTGAITNLQGQYSIVAKPGNTLEFQYLGMVSERKTVGGGITSIDVSLKEDSARVDEVVVVGYATVDSSADAAVTCETYVPDFSGNVYGQQPTLEFHKYFCPVRKFNSLDELAALIHHAADESKAYFDKCKR